MNVDPKNYVARLIKSIDFPVKRILVQIGAPDEFRNILFHLTSTTVLLSTVYSLGNKDYKIVRKIVKAVKEAMSENSLYVTSIEFNLLDYNPGSAKGFNFGLRTMMRCGLPFFIRLSLNPPNISLTIR